MQNKKIKKCSSKIYATWFMFQLYKGFKMDEGFKVYKPTGHIKKVRASIVMMHFFRLWSQ